MTFLISDAAWESFADKKEVCSANQEHTMQKTLQNIQWERKPRVRASGRDNAGEDDWDRSRRCDSRVVEDEPDRSHRHRPPVLDDDERDRSPRRGPDVLEDDDERDRSPRRRPGVLEDDCDRSGRRGTRIRYGDYEKKWDRLLTTGVLDNADADDDLQSARVRN